MGKIQETLKMMQAGARNNKYRVVYPQLGEDLDIVCNATTNPGRALGTVDVFIKGRKVQYAAEMSEEGTWEFTIYNGPNLFHRSFFLELINAVHNFGEPAYLTDTGGVPETTLNSSVNLGISGQRTRDFSGWGSLSNTFGKAGEIVSDVSNAVNSINRTYNTVSNSLTQLERTFGSLQDFLGEDVSGLQELLSLNNYGRPWYMQEVIIQQLDHDENVVSNTILHNAFVSSVGPIEYTDEVGDVSTSSVTFTYSGISYK